jgi:serpin B
LTNAIYFNGTWQSPFAKESTYDESFFSSATESKKVPMMHHGGRYRYFEGDGVQLVELPYKGDRLSMVVVLPKEKHNLGPAVEAKLGTAAFVGWLSAAEMKLGDIALPKFEFETKYMLSETLESMGMTRAFTDAAQFGGITSKEDLKISFVVHKAFVKVDEEGSEAAAATAVGVTRAAAPVVQKFQFRADQPFVFLIRDTQTHSILFVGRVSNPKS